MMKKNFFIILVSVLLFAGTEVFAQSPTSEVVKQFDTPDLATDEEMRNYRIVAGELPLDNSGLTLAELDEVKKNARYRFLGKPIKPNYIHLTGEVDEDVKAFGVILARVKLYSENLAESLSTIAYPAKREVVDETWRVLQEIGETIGRPVNETNNLLVKTSDSFTLLQGKVSANEDAIFALNIEEMNRKGFLGVAVKGRLNHLGQVYELMYMDGQPVDFKYIIPTGNLGGAQTGPVEKIVAVAYDRNTSTYAVLLCANTTKGEILKDGSRKLFLGVIADNCDGYNGTKKIVKKLCIHDDSIDQLFANHQIVANN